LQPSEVKYSREVVLTVIGRPFFAGDVNLSSCLKATRHVPRAREMGGGGEWYCVAEIGREQIQGGSGGGNKLGKWGAI